MTHDFLIIGGGIAGISAAAALAPLGSVLLLEAEDALGHHASGRSAATFEPYYGAPATVALSHASRDMLEGMGVLAPLGVLVVAGPEDADAFAADAAAFHLDHLSPRDAQALVPILNPAAITQAGITQAARDMDTDAMLQHFARDARALGATLQPRAPVTGISRRPHGWQVQAAGQTHDARHLVNAAGAWGDAVARLAGVAPLGLQPYRRSMARLPLPAGVDPSGWPMFMGAGETWYAKRDAGALIVSPAEADPMDPHDAWTDDMVIAEGLARYEAMVTAPVTRVLATWAGLRSYLPDGTLAIGPDAADPGFLWLVGQGGQGFQSACAAAQLLGDLVAGRAPALPADIVAALSPGRFA